MLLAAFILTDTRDWPAIGAAAIVAHGLALPFLWTTPLSGVGLAVAEVGSVLVGALIIGKNHDRGDGRRVLEPLVRFTLVAVLLSAPSFAVMSTFLWPGVRSPQMLVEHDLAFMLGVLLVSPIALTATAALRWLRTATWAARAELVALLALTGTMCVLAYTGPADDAERYRPVQVLVVLRCWGGIRMGSFAAAWSMAILGLLVEYGVCHRLGVMSAMAGDDFRHAWFSTIYLVILAVIALGNAAIIGGLRRAVDTLASTERWFRDLANASPLPMLAVEADRADHGLQQGAGRTVRFPRRGDQDGG